FPQFSFSNGAQLGNNGYVRLIENPMAHDFTGSLTKITAHHTIKFGGEFRRMLINFTQYGYPSGQFTFDQTWTQQIANSANGTGQRLCVLRKSGWADGLCAHLPEQVWPPSGAIPVEGLRPARWLRLQPFRKDGASRRLRNCLYAFRLAGSRHNRCSRCAGVRF